MNECMIDWLKQSIFFSIQIVDTEMVEPEIGLELKCDHLKLDTYHNQK